VCFRERWWFFLKCLGCFNRHSLGIVVLNILWNLTVIKGILWFLPLKARVIFCDWLSIESKKHRSWKTFKRSIQKSWLNGDVSSHSSSIPETMLIKSLIATLTTSVYYRQLKKCIYIFWRKVISCNQRRLEFVFMCVTIEPNLTHPVLRTKLNVVQINISE